MAITVGCVAAGRQARHWSSGWFPSDPQAEAEGERLGLAWILNLRAHPSDTTLPIRTTLLTLLTVC